MARHMFAAISAVLLAFGLSGCPSQTKSASDNPQSSAMQGPKSPAFMFEQSVNNEGFRGKFAFQTRDVVTVRPDRKSTDGTFKFTGAVMGRLVKEQRSIRIIRLDRDLMWDIDLNGNKYTERPITQIDIKSAQTDPASKPGLETVYIEDCCKTVTNIKKPGTKKTINNIDTTLVVLTAETKCQDGAQADAAKTTIEMWIADSLKLGPELSRFEEAYAKKTGFDPALFKDAAGAESMKMFPSLIEMSARMKDIKGYPILTTVIIEDPKYMEKRKKEEAQQASASSGGGDIAADFISRQMEERRRKQQADEDMKWGNVLWRMSMEAKDFKPADAADAIFELPDGLSKIDPAQSDASDNVAEAPGEARPVQYNYVGTVCFGTIGKAQLGIDIYPAAKPARLKPYAESDLNTKYFYNSPKNYRLQYATKDGFDMVVAFYAKIMGKKSCKTTTRDEGGVKIRSASCKSKSGVSFSMDDRVLEFPQPSEPDSNRQSQNPGIKMFGFELSAGGK